MYKLLDYSQTNRLVSVTLDAMLPSDRCLNVNEIDDAIYKSEQIIIKLCSQKVGYRFFNNSYNIVYFPSMWKNSIIHAILKPGKNPTLPAQYRLLLPPEQFGFRERHSTLLSLLRLTTDVTGGLNKKIPINYILFHRYRRSLRL